MELQAEINRLKAFGGDAAEFEERQIEFYKNVVFNDKLLTWKNINLIMSKSILQTQNNLSQL